MPALYTLILWQRDFGCAHVVIITALPSFLSRGDAGFLYWLKEGIGQGAVQLAIGVN